MQLRSRISTNIGLLNAFTNRLTRDNVVALVRNQEDQGRQAILDWLTPIDYALQQSDFISRRQAGTGQWLLDSVEFKAWLQMGKQTLFCPGIPGAGKTIFASIVVKELNTLFENDDTTGIVYLYCNFRRQYEQKLKDLFASLLKQFIQERPSIPDSVEILYRRHKDKRTRPSLDESLGVLQSVAATYSRVFIIVDALDECQISDGCRQKFLSGLFNLQAKCGANLLVTSRPISSIEKEFEGNAILQIRASEEDVRSYLEGYMFRLPGFVVQSLELQEEIKTRIVKFEERLRSNQFFEYAANNWGHHARKASTLSQPLSQALVDFLKSEAKVAASSQGLFATKDYSSHSDYGRAVPSWMTGLHLTAYFGVEAVVKPLLDTGKVEADSKDDGVDIKDGWGRTPLLYATRNNHESVVKLLLETGKVDVDTKDGYGQTPLSHAARNGHESVVKLLLETGKVDIDAEDYIGRTPFSHAIENGHESVVKLLLETGKVGVDVKDTHGRTPLLFAALNGHRSVIKLLLETGKVDIDAKDMCDQTPFSHAALKGHESIVRLLLETGKVDVGSKNCFGQTPLSNAIGSGHELVVKLLLEIGGVDLNLKDKHSLTPLSHAARNGHESIVKLLLETGKVDADVKDMWGWTPLSHAAINKHESIVKLLLETGKVDVDAKDAKDRNWISRAVFNGVIDIDVKGKEDGYLLLNAAFKGYKSIVKLLLDQGADVTFDTHGCTPLHLASYNGHFDVVKLLLEKGADVAATDQDGMTPLHEASNSGEKTIVKLLLAMDGIEPDIKDRVGRTSLFYAARNGSKAIVEVLLATNRVDVDSKDYYNSTPLSIAARMGHKNVVAFLLTKCHALNAQDNFGRTPLWWAKRTGYPEIADLLEKCEENGIIIQEDDLPTATISAFADRTFRYCDVCMLDISEKDIYYYCKFCSNQGFDICKECFAIKAHCLDQSHTLIKR
jgi:ankyrin repeat protein